MKKSVTATETLYRPLLLLLASLILLILLGGCGTAADETETTVTTTADVTTTEVTTEPPFDDGLPDTDLNGFEINFVALGESGGSFKNTDLYAEAPNGDLINDAVYTRNRLLEEKYNFTLLFSPSDASINTGGSRPADLVSKTALAGDDVYDVAYDGLTKLSPLASSKLLLDLNGLPNIDFSRPWWNEDYNADISLCDKLYYTYGSHMLGPLDGLYCIFYNKKLIEQYHMGDMYGLVADNKWTYETFASFIQDAAVDVNGDGVIKTDDDIIPYYTQKYNAYVLYLGAGEKLAEKDADGNPYISIGSERSLNVLERLTDMLTAPDAVFYINDTMKEKGNDAAYAYQANGFASGMQFFREGAMMDIAPLRNMDADFGILPVPKFDEAQENYYHSFSVWNAAMMSVPVTVVETEKVGFILEALAAESYNSLIPEYIERQLTTKLLRDDESEAMLNLIFDSITVDIGYVYSWGSYYDSIFNGAVVTNRRDFASGCAALSTSAEKAMARTVEIFSES